MHKKVKHLFYELGCTKHEVQEHLLAIHLENKQGKRVYLLSKEERILLSLKLACVRHPNVLLLAFDCSKISPSTLAILANELEKYVKKDNFLLLSQSASQLMDCVDQYEIHDTNIHRKQEYFFNFLEEKGQLTLRKTHKISYMKMIKWNQSFLTTCGNVLFFFVSTILICMSLLIVFAFSSDIHTMEMLLQQEKTKEEHLATVRACSNEKAEGFCSATQMTSTKLDALNSLEEVKQCNPLQELFVYYGDRYEEPQLLVDGKNILVSEDMNTFLAEFVAYDSSLFHTTSAKEHTTSKGVYISERVLNELDVVESDIKNKNVELMTSLDVPLYSQILPVRNFDTYGNSKETMHYNVIRVPYTITLPVLGVVSDNQYDVYMDSNVVKEIQAELINLYPKDSTDLNLNREVAINDYQPDTYQIQVKEYKDIAIVEEKLDALDPKMRLFSSSTMLEQEIINYTEIQARFRSDAIPFVLMLMFLLSVGIVTSGFFQKYSYIYSFRNQASDRIWMTRQLVKLFAVIVVIALSSYVLTAVFSMYNVQQFIFNSMGNLPRSTYNVDIYNSPMYLFLMSTLQILQSILLSPNFVLTLLLFSIIVGALKYAPTLYFYLKYKKLL